jgi:peroxidase
VVNSPRLSIDGTELPNPRTIACALHAEAHEIEPFITHMFMQWGQFITHDISSLSISTDAESSFSVCNSCTRTEKCFPIPIANNLTCNCILQMNHDCIEFTRSSSAFGDLQCAGEVREQLNLQTPFLDASLIYGTTKDQNEKLRDVLNGKGRLIMQQKRRLLPMDKTKEPSDCLDFTEKRRCFVSGDDRVNQNPGLMTMQTIMMREHNRIADILSELNPAWEDETVFQETRRVIIAMVQHITYNEYLPILLGDQIVTLMNLKPLVGLNQSSAYNPDLDPRTSNEVLLLAM